MDVITDLLQFEPESWCRTSSLHGTAARPDTHAKTCTIPVQIIDLLRLDLEEHRASDEEMSEMCSYNAKESCDDDRCHGCDKSTYPAWVLGRPGLFPKMLTQRWTLPGDMADMADMGRVPSPDSPVLRTGLLKSENPSRMLRASSALPHRQ